MQLPPAVALSPESSPKMLSSAPGVRKRLSLELEGYSGSCMIEEKFELAKLVVAGLFRLEFQLKALDTSKAYDFTGK
ncbi:hypothetical protein D5086_013223 [Populus alba]|uniref:Uncharacterized protein n=1 Tax=Populus alba TaxID=43335 RepID=A0ACC4C546_POPAL